MSGLGTNAFRNITAIPRKLNILPQNFATPQGAVDALRGKKPVRGKSVFGKALNRSLLTRPESEQEKSRATILT